MQIKAFIFDVDGTIADTEEAHRIAFNQAFELHGLGWHWGAAAYRQLLDVAGGKERICSYLDALPMPDAERARIRSRVRDIHLDKTRFYSLAIKDGGVPLRAGVARLFDEALSRGCKLAIASTATAGSISALLHSTCGPTGLDMFTVIACGDQVACKKPAPDIYQLALRRLGIAPEQAVAFEDSGNGLRAATAAGLRTVVTPCFWTEGHDFGDAALVLPHLGGPDVPLPGEPGRQLHGAPWLTCEEVERMAARHAAVAMQ
ncbi:HAD-IA family hydrolase [Variovorax sp. KK3]|uniref:HAD-IA family hydrolase n=1 Tax=Variovorax sp. KK3 TaxID=1855728 RepID=UPI00097CB832|nr:HAD-IA family hydrolase [Variovorax sp. KK3]